MRLYFCVLVTGPSGVVVSKFRPNRSTFESVFEYEYEYVTVFMDINFSYLPTACCVLR